MASLPLGISKLLKPDARNKQQFEAICTEFWDKHFLRLKVGELEFHVPHRADALHIGCRGLSFLEMEAEGQPKKKDGTFSADLLEGASLALEICEGSWIPTSSALNLTLWDYQRKELGDFRTSVEPINAGRFFPPEVFWTLSNRPVLDRFSATTSFPDRVSRELGLHPYGMVRSNLAAGIDKSAGKLIQLNGATLYLEDEGRGFSMRNIGTLEQFEQELQKSFVVLEWFGLRWLMPKLKEGYFYSARTKRYDYKDSSSSIYPQFQLHKSNGFDAWRISNLNRNVGVYGSKDIAYMMGSWRSVYSIELTSLPCSFTELLKERCEEYIRTNWCKDFSIGDQVNWAKVMGYFSDIDQAMISATVADSITKVYL